MPPDGFPDPDAALEQMDAIGRAQEIRGETMREPSASVASRVRVAAQRAGVLADVRRDLGVSGRMRWYAVVTTRRGEAVCRVVPVEGQGHDRTWLLAFEALGLFDL